MSSCPPFFGKQKIIIKFYQKIILTRHEQNLTRYFLLKFLNFVTQYDH